MRSKRYRSLRDIFAHTKLGGNERHALRSFNLMQVRNGMAQSVKELAEALGVDVYRHSLPRGMAGRLITEPFSESGFAIEVNESMPVQAQRFAVLHELGHFVLGHVQTGDPLASDLHLNRAASEFYTDEAQEREANAFASALLFGDGALESAASLHGKDIPKLAKIFGVSEKVIEIGLKEYRI